MITFPYETEEFEMGVNESKQVQHVEGVKPEDVKFPWPVAIGFAVVLIGCLAALFTGFAL